jgi:tetraacyldisaccharide 4'-kinase
MAIFERYFRELWEGKRRGPADRLLLAALVPLSVPYTLVLHVRALFYKVGILRSVSLGKPVISVGNISVGGTGKTPVTILLARILLARGKRVAVLSRGFGGPGPGEVRVVSDGRGTLLSPPDAADEPCLIARSVPGLIVLTGRDRCRAGLIALERFQPDIFILDDGFQHLRLRRDLNILLLDAENPFGNGRTLPAGLMREPASAIGRADLVLRTRCDASREYAPLPGIPSCRSSHRLAGIVPFEGGSPAPFSLLAGKQGIAFAGIAEPAPFFAALRQAGLALAATLAFRDHCRYDGAEVAAILRELRETGAHYLITTEKDAVKLAAHGGLPVDRYAAVLEIVILDPAVLETEIEKLL